MITWVNLIVIVRVIDVKLVWINPNNRASQGKISMLKGALINLSRFTISLMHLSYYMGILTLLEHIVIEFVPQCQSSKLWARKTSYGTEIQSVHSYTNVIYEETDN